MKSFLSTGFVIIIAILGLVSLYFCIKFLINFKKSIKDTKRILGKELIIPYVQGFKVNSNAFYNILIFNILNVLLIVFTALGISASYQQGGWIDPKALPYISYYVITLTFSILLILTFNLTILIMYYVMFNYAQYIKNKKHLSDEIKSLKLSVPQISAKYPSEIKLDIEKMKNRNILATKVLSKFLHFYNQFDSLTEKQQYLTYIDQLFKLNLFEESFATIEKQKQNEASLLNQNSPTPKQNFDSLSQLEKEIIWMDNADRKGEVYQESKKLEKNLGKEQFEKKYLEYLQSVRSQDPMYSNIQKNTWLTYRDNEFEDLFYNPYSQVLYMLSDSDVVLEKPLNEFLAEYKQYLINKFYSTK